MRTAAKDPGEGRGRWVKQSNDSRARAFVKIWIVHLAMRDWIPYGTATWLTQKGGLLHE